MILATDGTESYVFFVYGLIQWSTSATVSGFNSGNMDDFYNADTVSSLGVSANSGISGVNGYRVDQSVILEPGGEFMMEQA